MGYDPYDPMVAFDDVMGEERDYSPTTSESCARVLGAVLGIAHRRRSRPRLQLVGVSYDPTYTSFEETGVAYRIIGADGDTPIFDALHSQYAAVIPADKFVRVDDADSYADFRAARRAPYIAQLEARLSALESALRDHVADDERVHAAIARSIEVAAAGGSRVDLPVREAREGKIESWQDGGELLCTIRVVGPDGQLRMMTTGEPIAPKLEAVVGWSEIVGAEPEEVAAIAPVAAQVLGAAGLVQQLCCVVGAVAASSAPFVAKMKSASDPKVAAAMALVQRAQVGDRRSLAEVKKVARVDAGLIEHAGAQLARGQLQKAMARR